MNYFNWNSKIRTHSPGCGHTDHYFTESNLLSFDWGLPSIDFTAMPLWSDSAELQGLFFWAEVLLGLVSDTKVAVSILVPSDGGGPNTAFSIYTFLLTGIVLPGWDLGTAVHTHFVLRNVIPIYCTKTAKELHSFFFFLLYRRKCSLNVIDTEHDFCSGCK